MLEYAPWILFVFAVMWGTYKSWKLDECTRQRNRYYAQRNGLAGELLRQKFPESRRKWVDKFPPVPRGFAPEFVEEVSDFTEEELWFAMRIQGRYLEDSSLVVRTDMSAKPHAIRIPQELCLIP